MIQQGFPTQEVTYYNTPFISRDQLAHEGRVYRLGSTLTTGTYTLTRPTVVPSYSASISQGGFTVPVGRALLVTSYGASSDINAAWRFSVVQGVYSSVIGSIGQGEGFFGDYGGNSDTNCNVWIYELGSATLNGFAIGKMDGTSPVPRPNIGFRMEALEVTADFNYAAKYRVLLMGDSITTGGMGNDSNGNPYIGEHLYGFRLTNWLRQQGIDCRFINKGVAAENSRHLRQRITSGDMDQNADLWIVAVGVNDIPSNTISLAEYKENLKAIIDRRNTHRPDASIIFISPAATDLTSIAANVQQWRDACHEVATTEVYYGGGTINKVYHYDASTAFSLNPVATADINFQIPERNTGTRLHWSGIGHGLVFEGLKPVVQSTNFFSRAIFG